MPDDERDEQIVLLRGDRVRLRLADPREVRRGPALSGPGPGSDGQASDGA